MHFRDRAAYEASIGQLAIEHGQRADALREGHGCCHALSLDGAKQRDSWSKAQRLRPPGRGRSAARERGLHGRMSHLYDHAPRTSVDAAWPMESKQQPAIARHEMGSQR